MPRYGEGQTDQEKSQTRHTQTNYELGPGVQANDASEDREAVGVRASSDTPEPTLHSPSANRKLGPQSTRGQLGKPLGDFGRCSKYSSHRESPSKTWLCARILDLTSRGGGFPSCIAKYDLATKENRIQAVQEIRKILWPTIKHRLPTSISLTKCLRQCWDNRPSVKTEG